MKCVLSQWPDFVAEVVVKRAWIVRDTLHTWHYKLEKERDVKGVQLGKPCGVARGIYQIITVIKSAWTNLPSCRPKSNI